MLLFVNGLQEMISPSFSKDLGRKLENAVFWALRGKYQEIYYFNENNKKCDFVVCENNSPVMVMQVCLEVHAENQQREVNGLLEAMNGLGFSEGYIITLDQEDKLLIEGKTIRFVPFHRFVGELLSVKS